MGWKEFCEEMDKPAVWFYYEKNNRTDDWEKPLLGLWHKMNNPPVQNDEVIELRRQNRMLKELLMQLKEKRLSMR
jgi:hypothetical protein